MPRSSSQRPILERVVELLLAGHGYSIKAEGESEGGAACQTHSTSDGGIRKEEEEEREEREQDDGGDLSSVLCSSDEEEGEQSPLKRSNVSSQSEYDFETGPSRNTRRKRKKRS